MPSIFYECMEQHISRYARPTWPLFTTPVYLEGWFTEQGRAQYLFFKRYDSWSGHKSMLVIFKILYKVQPLRDISGCLDKDISTFHFHSNCRWWPLGDILFVLICFQPLIHQSMMDNVSNLRHLETRERIEITHRVLSCPGNFPPHLNFNGPWPSGLTYNGTLEQAPSPIKKAVLTLCVVCCVNTGELASRTCILPDRT